MTKHLFFISILLLGFTSCEKKESCGSPDTLYIDTNGIVYEGWPLKLFFNADYGSHIQISGPNGYNNDFIIDSDFYGYVTIDSTTMANSGDYVIKSTSNECVAYLGVVTVEIKPTPIPPCSIPDNTGTTTIGNIGATSYNSVYSQISGDHYFGIIGTSGTYKALNFYFNGSTKPRPGKYKSGGTYYPDTDSESEVAVHLISGSDFFILDGQDIFVTEENGKTVVTMCSSEFANSVGITPLYLSTKLVLP